MYIWLEKAYYKLFSLALHFLVKSESIPNSPSLEIKKDISHSPIVLYVLPYYSHVDLLTLRAQCLKHKLPDPLESLIFNGMTFPRYVFVYKYSNISNNQILEEKSIKIFYKYFSLHLDNADLDVQVVPVSVMFGRYPNRKKNKKLNSSTLQCFLNKIKKLFSVIWLGRDSFVHFFPSISLHKIAFKYRKDKTIIQKLIRMARIYFARYKLAVVGPPRSSQQDLFSKILSSKTVIRLLEEEAIKKKISYQKARENACLLIEEIAANFSYEMVRLTDRVLSFIWNRLYQKISVHNADRVRRLAYSGYEIVYLPCHRSHIDYLLISYVLYHQGLAPPHIAAGINLNFWPAGPIFRRLGAFFMRRTFKGDKLYSAVFREYLNEILNTGSSIEYFIEGGRSRTGRLLYPKTGTLSITIQSMLRGKTRPIVLVPIYIGYEHILEVNSYSKELDGAIKEKESFPKMLCGLSKLRNLGIGDINFGEPLQLTDWLNNHIPNWKESIDKQEINRPVWFTSIVNDIATDMMIRINNAGAINAMNLCCTAFVASYKLYLTQKQLVEQIDCYLDLMRNVPYSEDATIPSVNSYTLIEHALKMNKFKKEKSKNGDIIIIPHEENKMLNYYRNNIAHMLVLPSCLAIIITYCCPISFKRLLYYISILYPILKAELFLRWSVDELEKELIKFVKEFLRQKLLLIQKDILVVNPLRAYTFELLASSVAKEIFQRYAVIFWLLNINPTITRSTLKQECQNLAKRLSFFYGIDTIEFFDITTFESIILSLRSEGYIDNFKQSVQDKILKVYQLLSKLITSDIRLMIENNNSKILPTSFFHNKKTKNIY